MDAVINEFLKSDQLSDLKDAKQKLEQSTLPGGIHIVEKDQSLVLYSFSIQQNGKAVMDFSLTIREDLSFTAFIQDIRLDCKSVRHLVKDSIFRKCS